MMARDASIEQRLLRWAEWCKSGDGSGYPVKSTLHPDWSPPSPGITPSMKVTPHNDAPQTHRLVCRLSERMQRTLVAHYIKRTPAAAIGMELGCRADTVHDRIEAAHRALLGLLSAERGSFCNIQ